MPAHTYDVSSADFQQAVIEASRRVPVLVDFWAPWCGPCKSLGPILEKLAGEFGGGFILAKVNSDDNQELATRYGVRGIPNVKAFVDGELVDEFTGALAEAKVREFITRLLPSPAEPLRSEAAAALARGDTDAARKLLRQALATDPGNGDASLDLVELEVGAGGLAAAKEILAVVADSARDSARVEALQARLRLAEAGQGLDAEALARAVAANPADLDARLQLANALALRGAYRAAFEHLLEIVRRDRKFGDEAGRKTMLTLFALLAKEPQYDDLVREFRLALGRTLN